MTVPELVEHLDKLEKATEQDYDEFINELLEQPYAELEQQNN